MLFSPVELHHKRGNVCQGAWESLRRLRKRKSYRLTFYSPFPCDLTKACTDDIGGSKTAALVGLDWGEDR